MKNQKFVFVSYSSKDRQFVNQIVKTLEDMGISCWRAPEMIPAGSSYAKEIPKAIRECELFLLMLSRTSQESIWVEKEIDSAISSRKTIIPFQIDNTPLNDTFRFYLNNVQMISYAENPDMAMEDLKRMLEPFAVQKEPIAEVKDNTEDIPDSVIIKESHLKKIPEAAFESEAKTGKRSISYHNQSREEIVLAMQGRRAQLKYDDYQTIRDYLKKVGAASMAEIERDTGVPRRVIKDMFEDEDIIIH